MATAIPSTHRQHDRQSEKRSTSSVLRSILNPLGHKRTPSSGATLANETFNENYGVEMYGAKDAPHRSHTTQAANLPLGEIEYNQTSNRIGLAERSKSDKSILHSRALSSVSQGLGNNKGDENRKTRGRSKTASDGSESQSKEPKKAKSQTGLAALFSRPRSSKGQKAVNEVADKENQTPSAVAGDHAPIWAQFATQKPEGLHIETRGMVQSTEFQQEIDRSTPTDYRQSQQRIFGDIYQPALSRRPSETRKVSGPSERPYSIQITSSSSSTTSFREAMQHVRRNSVDKIHTSVLSREPALQSRVYSHENNSRREQTSSRKSSIDMGPAPNAATQDKLNVAKRGSRVMAAVAALNGKADATAPTSVQDEKSIENAFEALLESRNVPLQTRQKMRALDSSLKANLLKQDKLEKDTAKEGPKESKATKLGRSPSKSRFLSIRSRSGSQTEPEDEEEILKTSSPNKRSRPLSKNFSLHKNDRDASPTKRLKSGDHGTDHADASKSTKSLRSTSTRRAIVSGFSSKPNVAVPGEYVAYLRKVREPASVEVGRLHKLRLVLRNERVEWVDNFINAGGMKEIVDLLHRIMELEWREEHEDHLLHETLLCLKALCTTAVALKQLMQVQEQLFPALLKMLFDDERKGPSEYTTRGIIITVMFTFLESAPDNEKPTRAKALLGYLQDPKPSEAAHDFIYTMHNPRPYRVWFKEPNNVTKEVFWIFLHAVNVIAINSPPKEESYVATHFPRDRSPAAAGPHIGGVEWEATNYLADHIDLMNGIIASLPSRSERNALRAELRASGFERLMGGSLRTCKEKFYGAVHDALRTWVAAAAEDGWAYGDVRNGPRETEERKVSPKKRVETKKVEAAPKIELPKLGLIGDGDSGETGRNKQEGDDVWL